MAERCEAISAKRSFASKYFKFLFLTRSFASRFLLRFAQPFLARLNLQLIGHFPARIKLSLLISKFLGKLIKIPHRNTVVTICCFNPESQFCAIKFLLNSNMNEKEIYLNLSASARGKPLIILRDGGMNPGNSALLFEIC